MIIRHDRSDRDCLEDERKWPALTSFFRGSGGAALIAPRWLLTAAHVVGTLPDSVRLSVPLAGRHERVARIILHPDYDPAWTSEDEDDTHETVDLALVELEIPVEDVAPLPLYEKSDEAGREVLLLGAGQFGNGQRGVRGSDRALRRATNRIDSVDARWLKFRFDEPPDCTSLEGVGGNGDSGWPALIQEGERFLIAGISSWQKTEGRPLGIYGCVEHYTRVSQFVDWIRATCDLDPA
jgi:hypothetical protein